MSTTLSGCIKERLTSINGEQLSPNFEPTTTPINVLDLATTGNVCFYENNFVKLVGYDPEAVKYKWLKKNSNGQYQIISNDSIVTVSQKGEYCLDMEKSVDSYADWDTTIFISIDYCPINIEFPEAFYPNNDGQYDTWFPILNGVSEFNLNIRTINDDVVFTTSSFNAQFDGTYNNNSLPSGTYFYYISGTYRNGYLFEFSGDFTLVR